MSRLLDALHGKNLGRPPVWLMRQAGRYMPSYRALRAKYSLKVLFSTPELAAEITLQPIREFGVDAAILFSDITLLALGFGLELEFTEGPVVFPKVSPTHTLQWMPERLECAVEAVRLLKPELTVPLIGFCGGPFTVASYLSDAKEWMAHDPVSFERFLGQVTELSIDLLQRQIEAGVEVVQVFESWGNELSKEEFRRFSLPYLRRMVEVLKVPVIVFMRGGVRVEEELGSLKGALSCDWERPLAVWRESLPATALQGNLDPDILCASQEVVKQKTQELLESMRGDPAFVLNLGHGVKPGTPMENVRCFIDTCRSFF